MMVASTTASAPAAGLRLILSGANDAMTMDLLTTTAEKTVAHAYTRNRMLYVTSAMEGDIFRVACPATNGAMSIPDRDAKRFHHRLRNGFWLNRWRTRDDRQPDPGPPRVGVRGVVERNLSKHLSKSEPHQSSGGLPSADCPECQIRELVVKLRRVLEAAKFYSRDRNSGSFNAMQVAIAGVNT